MYEPLSLKEVKREVQKRQASLNQINHDIGFFERMIKLVRKERSHIVDNLNRFIMARDRLVQDELDKATKGDN